jgi:hypothetical protein
MRRYERASTLLTSNRPIEDWGKLLGDAAAITAMLDRLLHHGTYSSAVRAAGEPRPKSPRTRLYELQIKPKAEAGQEPPGVFASVNPGTSAPRLHQRIS